MYVAVLTTLQPWHESMFQETHPRGFKCLLIVYRDCKCGIQHIQRFISQYDSQEYHGPAAGL